MALAPRHPDVPHAAASQERRQTGKKRDSGLGKEGKRRQRERNANSPTKGLTASAGSSGIGKYVAQMPKVDWADIEEDLVHLCDIAGKMSHVQVGSSGWQISTLNVPLAYAHDVLEAHMAGQQGMLYLRVYYAPIEKFLSSMDEDGVSNGDEQQPA